MTPAVAGDTAAVVVTHNGAHHVEEQLDSILGQTLLPAVIVVIDDDSRDGTRALVREIRRFSHVPIELVRTDGSTARDLKTRVARNVSLGLARASGFDLVLLADQDDAWLPDRLEGQRRLLLDTPGALLVAGDGILVDERGRTVGGRLRDRFPVPGDWGLMGSAARMRASLRIPYVTGAAMALTRELADLMTPIPAGWLHDRWATLVAASRSGLVLQVEPVIRYRVHDTQAVGFRQAEVGAERRRWQQVLARGASPVDLVVRAGHVVTRIRPLAVDPGVRAELGWPALVRSGRSRAGGP